MSRADEVLVFSGARRKNPGWIGTYLREQNTIFASPFSEIVSVVSGDQAVVLLRRSTARQSGSLRRGVVAPDSGDAWIDLVLGAAADAGLERADATGAVIGAGAPIGVASYAIEVVPDPPTQTNLGGPGVNGGPCKVTQLT